MDTVATDTVDTTGLMATTMERGPLRLSQSPLLLILPLRLTPLLMLMPGTATTATDTVAMDTVDTTVLMATMVYMERGLLMLSQSPLLLPTLTLLLIPGMAMDTVATDTVDTTGLMATMATAYMERGPQRLSQSPPLLPTLPLWLTPLLMLMPGMATVATVATATVATATDIDTATTAHMDMPTGVKQAKREVDSSSDCDFPSTLASISRACA